MEKHINGLTTREELPVHGLAVGVGVGASSTHKAVGSIILPKQVKII